MLGGPCVGLRGPDDLFKVLQDTDLKIPVLGLWFWFGLSMDFTSKEKKKCLSNSLLCPILPFTPSPRLSLGLVVAFSPCLEQDKRSDKEQDKR